MIARYEAGLAVVVALFLSFGMAVAGEMTAEDAKKIPNVVVVTQYDGSIAYYRNYDDYNANKPVAVDKSTQTTVSPSSTPVVQTAVPSFNYPPQQTQQSRYYHTDQYGRQIHAQPTSPRNHPVQSETRPQQPARRPNFARGLLNFINPLPFEIPGSEPADLFPCLMNNPAYREERRKRGLE